MKILVLTREFPPYVLGGISYHLRSLYNEVVSRGHDVTVLAGKCPQSWDDLGGSVSDRIEVEPVEFGFRKGYYLLYPLALKRRLRSVDTSSYDVVVSHTPLPFRIPDSPLVTKYHDCVAETRQYMRSRLSIPERIGDSVLHPIRTRIDQRSLRYTDHAIFNSHVNKAGWLDSYTFDGFYSVIHNGVDTELFSPKESDREDYVVFVGTTQQKGIDTVVEYATRNQRPVHIVGDIDLNHPNIVCHGRLSQGELEEIYTRATATVHPAHFESFGNAVLESLACGTPVVTTPTCGASELLTECTGIVTRNLDQGIERAATLDTTECRRVAEQHSWEEVADRTLRVFSYVQEHHYT